MGGTLIVIRSECERSVPCGEESGKMSFRAIDSSLGVMLPFPVFLEQHSCVHSE